MLQAYLAIITSSMMRGWLTKCLPMVQLCEQQRTKAVPVSPSITFMIPFKTKTSSLRQSSAQTQVMLATQEYRQDVSRRSETKAKTKRSPSGVLDPDYH